MTHSVIAIDGRFRPSTEATTVSISEGLGPVKNALRFASHEHLFFQGDPPKGIYQVISGTIIVYKLTADGRRQVQDFASEGDFLGLTFANEHDLCAEALTDAQVEFVPRAAFERALQDDSEFRRNVLTLMGEKLMASRAQAMLLGRKTAMERTATFLLFLAGRFSDPQTGTISIRMSRCDIADYLGLTLETVSRMMNRMKKDGVIELPRATEFKVHSFRRLSERAGESDRENDFVLAQSC